MTEQTELIFLKLGGSLITDKFTPQTALPDVIARLAAEIKFAWNGGDDFQLVLGHGSGSFGHAAASKYGTRGGVQTPDEWLGFAEVWYQASALNRLVIEALVGEGLPAVSYPVSAGLTAENGKMIDWNTEPIKQALKHKLLPVVYGDVVIDSQLGGTIFSTEDIFRALAYSLPPDRILLAGIEDGVWKDYPLNTEIIPSITAENYQQYQQAVVGSAAEDVTGGMAAKVAEMLLLCSDFPGLSIQIFSGASPNNIKIVLEGKKTGTEIS